MVKKLSVLSDLHTEFAGHDPPKDLTGVDVIVASGDIGPGSSGLNWLLDNFPRYLPVVYVPGNHEYYKHNYPALLEKLRHQARHTNARVLNNEWLSRRRLRLGPRTGSGGLTYAGMGNASADAGSTGPAPWPGGTVVVGKDHVSCC
jgi:hypothetical protein